jgi:hypothetical protein
MRLPGLLIAALVLTGCAGRGHAAAPVHRVYEARVTVGDIRNVVWLDLAGGRFRLTMQAGHRRMVTVSDRRTAVTRLPGLTTRTIGSPSFLIMTADPAVRALRARLLGRSDPVGTTVTGLHLVRAPSAALFTIGEISTPTQFARQVRVGVTPQTGPRAYWLGDTFNGEAPSYAFVARSKHASSYTVAYPAVHVEVDSSRFRVQTCATTPVELADGTRARLVVTPNDLGPCEDGSSGVDFSEVGSDTETSGGGLAVVETAHGTILLYGRAVSAGTASAIAGALRPV